MGLTSCDALDVNSERAEKYIPQFHGSLVYIFNLLSLSAS